MAAMSEQPDKCATCSKSRKSMDEQDWECSAVECPCRPVCWAGGRSLKRNAVAKVPNPIADLLDRVEV